MWRNRYAQLGFRLIGLLSFCCGQSDTSPPQDHGLITTFYYSYRTQSQMRHFPVYPGFEDVPGELNDDGIIEADVPDVAQLLFSTPDINMQSLGVDYRDEAVYMYDFGQSTITMASGYNKDLNINHMEFHDLHVAVSKGDIKVAVDWISHNVYWTDPGFRWIIVAPGQLDKIEKDYFKIIVRYDLDKPNGLALDPIEGKLCWSDTGKHPKIECSDLMGKSRNYVLHDNLKNPTGLATDIAAKRLYWLDDFTDSLLTVSYNGNDIKTVTRITYSNFFEMEIFRDVMYVSDRYSGYIYSLNKTNGKQVENPIKVDPYYKAYGIAVYGDEKQPLKETDFCAAKNCDHFCITTKNGAQCVCSEDYKLDEKTGKCKEYAAGFHKAIVLANETHICLVDIRSFAEPSAFTRKCIFTVFKQKPGTTTASPGRKKRQVSSSPDGDVRTTAKPGTTQKPTPTTVATTTIITTTPVPPGDIIKKFDMDMQNRTIYFVTADNSIYERPIDLPIENDAKELLVRASGNITGLAYDAEDPRKLYWCEDTGHVRVFDTRERASINIYKGSSENIGARDIIILLGEGKLVMIIGSYPNVSLQIITTTGQEQDAVVSGKSEIVAFTYDSEQKLFYYVSSRTMYSVSLTDPKSDRRVFAVEAGVISLVSYNNYLTWIYQNGTKLGFKSRDLLRNTITDPSAFGNTSLLGVKILDAKLQTPEHISPCAKDNGGCSQVCITKYENGVMAPVCSCRLGYTVENDVNCTTAVVEDDFILVADWTEEEILQISLKTEEVHIVPGEGDGEYNGVFYDEKRKKVIYAKYFDSKIYMLNLNGTDRQIIADTGNDGYAYRFHMDWTSGNLYFTAFFSSFIGLITPSGDYLVLNDEFGWDYVYAIVVHPKLGWMYYTVYSWPTAYVGRSNMDGSNSEKLIRASDGEYPDGLALDYIHDHLYWSDAAHDTIQQCNLDGLDCITIVNKTESGDREEIRDLATDGVYLYYSTYRRDYIVRVDLTNPEKTEIVGRNYGLGKLDTMSFYSSKNKNSQPLFDGCRDRNGLGDCSTICLPHPEERKCACNSGVSLKVDGRTCSDIYQCVDVVYQTVNLSSGITDYVEAVMDGKCLRYLDTKCRYSCPLNFEPVFDTQLTCTKVGWNLEPNNLCREIVCPSSIENGKIADNCTRAIGVKCDFECNAGFVKTRERAVCTKDGTFHVPHNELCAPYTCSEDIVGGSLQQDCPRTIGSKCKYTCDKFHSPSVQTSIATCEATGWNPASTALCQESVCGESSLANGIISKSCQSKIGDACMFQCNQGYVNSTSLLFCKGDKMWHPTDSCTLYMCSDRIENGVLDQSCAKTLGSSCNFTCNKYYNPSVTAMQATCGADGWSPASTDLCEYVKCPSSIPNGEITGDCDFAIGTTCNFKCKDDFTPSDLHPNISCNYEGKWFSDKLCLVPPPKKFELSTPGAVAGLSILAVLVIVLGVATIVLFRRTYNKETSSKYSEFDNNYGRSISLGNAMYGQDSDVQIN